MKNDIRSSADIELLVESFYSIVLQDERIGRFFTEIHPIDPETHFSTMVQFWETALLRKGTYRGNPIRKHIMLNRLSALEEHHFTRWTELWSQTVDDLFEGEVAEEAKKRAKIMKTIMQVKIDMSQQSGFIQ